MPWIKVCIFPTPRLNPKSFDYFLFTRKKIFFYFFWYEWGTHVRLRWFLKWKSEWQWRRKLVSFIFPRATHNASKPRECGSPTMFFFFFFPFQGGWCSWLLAVKVAGQSNRICSPPTQIMTVENSNFENFFILFL